MRRILSRQLSSSNARAYKIVIVGGGPVGMSAAVHLARLGLGKDVVVIERDSRYTRNSAVLSAGGMRQQFSLKENIELCMYSHKFLGEIEQRANEDSDKATVQFKRNGYFFMASTNEGKDILATNVALQHACGATWIQHTEDMSALAQTFPWLQTQGDVPLLAGAYSKGGGEGYFDPWGLIQAMKSEAIACGVTVVNGLVVNSTMKQKAAGTNGGGGSSSAYDIDSLHVALAGGAGNSTGHIQIVSTSTVVNAAGCYAGKFTNMIADSIPDESTRQGVLRIPVHPRKRCVFAVHCPGKSSFSHPAPTSSAPLTVDPSGVYFRGEGSGVGNFICGVSPQGDNDKEETSDSVLDIVDHHLFQEIIWPTLAERVPAFNELKVKHSWSGFYDYNALDQNAIIGYHPQVSNMVHANGFSGHGLQMSPAVGRAVAELITSGQSTSVDLTGFGLERIASNSPYYETGIV